MLCCLTDSCAFLELLSPPVFTAKLTDKQSVEEDVVRFQCQVEGKPRPEVVW